MMVITEELKAALIEEINPETGLHRFALGRRH